MVELARAQCRSCGMPVSWFARACPHCHASNQPNPVATSIALLAVILIAGAVALGVKFFHAGEPPRTAAQGAQPAAGSTAGDTAEFGWIVKAMAECEEEAKQKLDTLHFLIVPVTATGHPLPGWSPVPISDVGASAKLLTSTDALIGLRNGALELYQKPVTFVISDPASKTIYKWKPAVGVAALGTKETSFEKIRLGFELPDVAGDIEWGPTIAVSKGTCYWINPLVLAPTRSG
jgi:hypothetical protein